MEQIFKEQVFTNQTFIKIATNCIIHLHHKVFQSSLKRNVASLTFY